MNTKPLSSVKNPLAMIAIFAGISEIAMSITLLKIPESLQSTFIWFVMSFPFVLVGAFYFVLYRKPAVLFSPSDYAKDEMYLTSINGTSQATNDLKIKQLQESVTVLQDFMEQVVSTNNSNTGIEKKFAEAKQRLESIHQMEYNALFSFLTNEIELTNEQVVEIIKTCESINCLPEAIYHLTNDKWKSERVDSVLKNFTESSSDFLKLLSIIRGD